MRRSLNPIPRDVASALTYMEVCIGHIQHPSSTNSQIHVLITDSALTRRLQDMTNERNELSAQVRHGVSAQEKDEYAKEIQRLTRIKKQYFSFEYSIVGIVLVSSQAT